MLGKRPGEIRDGGDITSSHGQLWNSNTAVVGYILVSASTLASNRQCQRRPEYCKEIL